MNSEDLKQLAIILDKASTEQIIAIQQFLNAVVVDKVNLASQKLGLIKVEEEAGEEEEQKED
jgi:hypothetical protein